MALGVWRWASGVRLLALDFSRWDFRVWVFGVGVLALGFCVALFSELFALARWTFGVGIVALVFWHWTFHVGIFTFGFLALAFLALVFLHWPRFSRFGLFALRCSVGLFVFGFRRGLGFWL